MAERGPEEGDKYDAWSPSPYRSLASGAAASAEPFRYSEFEPAAVYRSVGSGSQPQPLLFDAHADNQMFLNERVAHFPEEYSKLAPPALRSSKPQPMFEKPEVEVHGLSEIYEQEGPPLAVDGYLEPHYHFYSSSDGDAIVTQVVAVLSWFNRTQPDSLDFEANRRKYKIKCVLYSEGGSVRIPFNVRVFSLERETRLAVEFQRRSGDSLRFCAMYRLVLKELQGKGVVHSAEGVADCAPPRTLQVGPDEQAEDNATHTVQCLLKMLFSDCVDVQSQAAGALADLAMDQCMVSAMVDNGVVEALVNASRSGNCDVHRCAVTGLGHMTARNNTAATQTWQLGGVTSAARLCNQRATPHMQRVSMRLILNVADKVRTDIHKCKEGDESRRLFEQLTRYPPSDTVALQSWQSVQSKIGATAVAN